MENEGGVEAAEEKDLPHSPDPLPFLEVTCRSSGKVWRFAAGTEAGFAVYLINRRQQDGTPPAFHIQAVKEGEEPVNFGPKAALANYGEGWKLKTATEEAYEMERHQVHSKIPDNPYHGAKQEGSEFKFSIIDVAKIIIAFLFIFLLGGIFTYILENLPTATISTNSPL